jgi:hypothetical protein
MVPVPVAACEVSLYLLALAFVLALAARTDR